MVRYFLKYIKGEQFKYPSDFYVTLDGTDGTYWFCREMTNCSPGSPTQILKIVKERLEKSVKNLQGKEQ